MRECSGRRGKNEAQKRSSHFYKVQNRKNRLNCEGGKEKERERGNDGTSGEAGDTSNASKAGRTARTSKHKEDGSGEIS